MQVEQKLDLILQRLDSIEAQLTPKRHKARVDVAPDDIVPQRIAEAERIFLSIVNDNAGKRRSTYKFPDILVEAPNEPFTQACPLSTLLNQLSLRKVFKLRSPSDLSTDTPKDVARSAILLSNLFVLTLDQAGLKKGGNRKIVATPAQLEAWGVDPSVVAWRNVGWSCVERPESKVNPEDGSPIEPWSEPDKPKQDVSNPQATEPAPEPEGGEPAVKFQFASPETGGRRTRVSFPEED